MEPPALSADSLREQLEKVLSSATFQGAERSRSLLRFLVEETISLRADRLKEYTIGAEALGRGQSFDQRTDPIVRAEASRLRSRLDRYYATEGQADAVAIVLPKGSYVPQFQTRPAVAAVEAPVLEKAQSRMSRRGRLLWPAAGAVVAVAILFWSLPRITSVADQPLLQVDVELRSGGALGSEVGTDVVFSPDGTRLVFVSRSADGTAHLNTRRLDQPAVTLLADTDGARAPFFSPDGRWVGFWASGKLKKTPVDGGSPVILCDATDLQGGSWGEDGTIIAAINGHMLSRVPSSGGPPIVVADLTRESLSPVWPQVLQGGKAILFTAIGPAGADAATIEALSLPDGKRHILVRGGTYGRVLSTGYLTYVNQGTLFATPIDVDRMEAPGVAIPILSDIWYSSTFGFAQMDVSRSGTLVYRRSMEGGQFTIASIDGSGAMTPLLEKPGRYGWPRLSPDGQHLAMSVVESGSTNLVIHDLGSNQTRRLEASGGDYGFPAWSPDGRTLVLGGPRGLAAVRSDGGETPTPLLPGRGIQIPWSFTPDGSRLAYHEMNQSTGFDLWTVPVQGVGSALKAGPPEPFLQTPAFEVYPAFSPDGRWLAYGSNESGTWEVYVRAFPDTGRTVQVSSAGGRIPRWSLRSRELFYRTDDQRLMVTTYTANPGSFVVATPREWSHGPIGDTGVLANFDVTPDGQRVVALMPASRPEDQQTANHVTLMLNFSRDVQRRAVSVGK